MGWIFRVSKKEPQGRCRASCKDFDDAGADKTPKPGGAGSQTKIRFQLKMIGSIHRFSR